MLGLIFRHGSGLSSERPTPPASKLLRADTEFAAPPVTR